MRWTVFLLLLLGCPPGPVTIVVGAPCTSENIGRCDAEAPRLLQCTNGVFRLYADCKGPKGCSVTNDTADCDTSGNTGGDHCAPTSEGKVRCDPDGGMNVLQCDGGALEVIWTCEAPRVCGIGDAGLTCIL